MCDWEDSDTMTFAELPGLKSLAKRHTAIRIEFKILPDFSPMVLFQDSSSSLYDDFSKSHLTVECFYFTRIALDTKKIVSLWQRFHSV